MGKYTIAELESMLNEISWSGTDGFNIQAQKKLVEQLLELEQENERLHQPVKRS
ncbi:hypothetical protein D3C81_428130 [compost metagenome]